MNSKSNAKCPLISVIVPVYKVEDYLCRCVDSILNQTYTNIEVILVDDGSPDRCGEICDAYISRDHRVKVLHKKNGGLSSARNVGLEAASGELIGFVDSDDYIEPDMYERMFQAMSSYDADLCICNTQYVYEDVECEECVQPSPMQDEVLDAEGLCEKFLLQGYFYYVTAWNKLYDAKLLEGIRFPEGKVHEDEFVAHHILGACKRAVTLSVPLYNYVQRIGSIMNAQVSIKKLDGVLALYDRYLYFKQRKKKKLQTRAIRHCYSLYLSVLRNVGWKQHKDVMLPVLFKIIEGLKGDLRAIKLLAIWLKVVLKESGA